MKVNGNKILILCDLPTDYGLPKLLECQGLPLLTHDHFYVITKDKKLVDRSYLDDGFSFEDIPISESHTFNVSGFVQGAMGLWNITYRVITDSGSVNNIYELNTTI